MHIIKKKKKKNKKIVFKKYFLTFYFSLHTAYLDDEYESPNVEGNQE